MSEVTNGQILEAIMSLKSDVGGLKNGQENAKEHTESVSRKIDGVELKLDNHINDTAAHGVGVERRIEERRISWYNVKTSWVVAGLAALELLDHVVIPAAIAFLKSK